MAEDSLALYINGIEDAAVNLRGVPLANEGDLVVGAGAGRPGFEGYIDDLRYYKRPMAEAEIAGFSVPGLTGVVDHDFVRIGNHACKYAEAMAPTTCGPFHELCSLEELYETAFHVARWVGVRHVSLWPIILLIYMIQRPRMANTRKRCLVP